MKIIVLLLSIFIFIKTTSYGIYELKLNNKSGGIFVIIISVISVILPNLMVYFRGI